MEEVQCSGEERDSLSERNGDSISAAADKETERESPSPSVAKAEEFVLTKTEPTETASSPASKTPTPSVIIKKEEPSAAASPTDPSNGAVEAGSAPAQPLFKIRKRIGKDPTVDTSYLPDKERDAQLAAERQRLVEEYRQKEEAEKRRPLSVTYSYWDGTGHRRRIQVLRGSTVGEFLAMARKELEKEFVELRCVIPENLMYVKEDLILPHNITFFELIRSKARGKSGPLFHFDAHDDVRVFNDVRTEKEDSHAGKIVDKKWFERNKHIFPASRWEVFNPSKTYDTYTIYGDERMWKGVADHSNLVPW